MPQPRPISPRIPQMHAGPITGSTLGRADARPMKVAPGSYVMPAAVVSHLGQGNTLAGNKVLDAMFKTGPYGTKQQAMPRGRGMGLPRPPAVGRFADGGGLAVPPQDEAVPIYAADGEWVLAPEQVASLGDGDMKRGHAILDEFVKQQLADAAKTIRALPGPRQR